jgi:hypothetical protein
MCECSYSKLVSGRSVVSLASEAYDFSSAQFYVVLAPVEPTSVPFRFFFVQSLTSINLFVFFAVFFSSFFLFLAAVIVVFKVPLFF